MIQNLLIVDDENKIREALRAIVFSFDKSIQCEEARSVKEADALLSSKVYDVIILDVQLGDGTGFDLLKNIPLSSSKIIFVTAFDNYAVQAFKYSALDYLLKPVSPTELKIALDKARQAVERDLLETRLNVLISNINLNPKKIILKTTDKIYVVGVHEIIHLKAEQNYTQFFLSNGTTIMISKTIKEYDELLSPSGFMRVHQSHLVNLDFIDRYEKRDGGFLVLKDKSIVPVSIRKKEEVLDRITSL